jgi:hypothetical protein
MEKSLARLSYWLGVLCTVLAVLARLLNMVGVNALQFNTRGNGIGYRTFLAGAILFFVMAIASASFDALNKRSS